MKKLGYCALIGFCFFWIVGADGSLDGLADFVGTYAQAALQKLLNWRS